MELNILDNSHATQNRVCATCNYADQMHDPPFFNCTNPETKHPPFPHPIIWVRGTDAACDKYWERHAAFTSLPERTGRSRDDIDQRILKYGAGALLLLFVIAIFRDKLGDVFPVLRTYIPWLF